MELVIHQGLKRNLVGVQNGVKDVVTIQLLYKNTIYTYADVVFVKSQYLWGLIKLGESMPAINVLANLFTTLYNSEDRKKTDCIILPASKLATKVLATLKNEGYIGEFEQIEDNRGGKFRIRLLAKITKCGVITPRFKVTKNEYNLWEERFLPSFNRGMLIVTTNQGVMSHHEAANKGLGGFLIGYVY